MNLEIKGRICQDLSSLIMITVYQKRLQPNCKLVQPTEKVSRPSVTSGKNESRALKLNPHFMQQTVLKR